MDELLEQGLVMIRELLEQTVTRLARGIQVLRRGSRFFVPSTPSAHIAPSQ
jgi:hypothetical protein